jgi:hypothetical protein
VAAPFTADWMIFFAATKQMWGRIRKRGGGRKPNIAHDRTLLRDLKTLVEPATRGDPMKSLL